jgi:hypothetical protein
MFSIRQAGLTGPAFTQLVLSARVHITMYLSTDDKGIISMGIYQPDTYIKPGPNLQFILWLVLLGLPALLLFMIFFKTEELATPRSMETPMQHAAPHH